MSHLNNKQNKNTNAIISRQDNHLTQPCLSEEKQTKKKKQIIKNSAQFSPYMKLIQATGPTLGGQKTKEKIQPSILGKRDFKHNKLKK